MTINQLESHIHNSSIPAIESTDIVETNDGDKVVDVKFRDASFTNTNPQDGLLSLYSYTQGETLNFKIPLMDLDDAPPHIACISWIQAHDQVPFGQYCFNTSSGEIRISGQLPLSTSKSNQELVEWGLQRVVHTFYIGEINIKANTSIRQAVDDGIISDDQAGQKIEQFAEEARELIGLSDGNSSSSDSDFAESGI